MEIHFIRQFLELTSLSIQKTYKARKTQARQEKTLIFSNLEVGNFILNLPVMESITLQSKKTTIITPKTLAPFCPKKSTALQLPNKTGEKLKLLIQIIKSKPDCIVLIEPTLLGIITSILLLPFKNKRIDLTSAFLEEQWLKNQIKPIHLTEYNLNVIEKNGFKKLKTKPEIKPSIEDEKKAIKILKQNKINDDYFIIFPGSSDKQTRWKAENFAKTADALSSKAKPVIAQGPDDRESAKETAKKMKKTPTLLPVIPLPILAAVLQKAKFYIGMDTGPAHLAAAVNCPTISIFTRGCPYWYYPYTQKGIAVYLKAYVSETSRRVKPEALAKAPDSFNLITPNCVIKATGKALSTQTQTSKKIPFNGFACD